MLGLKKLKKNKQKWLESKTMKKNAIQNIKKNCKKFAKKKEYTI